MVDVVESDTNSSCRIPAMSVTVNATFMDSIELLVHNNVLYHSQTKRSS